MRWLARIPGFPQLFDAALASFTAVFRPARLRAIDKIESMVAAWPGMRTGVHRFGGIGFFLHGKECGHIHGNGLLDCFVGPANRNRLLRDGQALPHHIFPRSGWVSYWVENSEQVDAALRLIRVAVDHRRARE